VAAALSYDALEVPFNIVIKRKCPAGASGSQSPCVAQWTAGESVKGAR
jgi:hypothetical protein